MVTDGIRRNGGAEDESEVSRTEIVIEVGKQWKESVLLGRR